MMDENGALKLLHNLVAAVEHMLTGFTHIANAPLGAGLGPIVGAAQLRLDAAKAALADASAAWAEGRIAIEGEPKPLPAGMEGAETELPEQKADEPKPLPVPAEPVQPVDPAPFVPADVASEAEHG